MTAAQRFFQSALPPICALLCGCIGMRTPLNDAARGTNGGSDSTKDSRAGDGQDRYETPGSGDASDSVGPACGTNLTIDTRPVQADILILLDRSDSMTWDLSSDEACTPAKKACTSRAAAVVPAVEAIVANNPDINWGLELFPYPDEPTCRVASAPQVAVGPGSAPAIKDRLATFTTAASTPTATAIVAATNYLKTIQDDRNKAILLATDGYPTCGYPPGKTEDVDQMLNDATTAATAAKNAGFPVYVIGIGQSMDNLNRLARAGGTGSYYLATSTKDLDNSLKAIAKAFSPTCTFKADTVPPDKNLATVYVDDKPVAKDDNDGWMFDPADSTDATITLTGSYCRDMLAGANAHIQIVFACGQDASADVTP